MMPPTKIELSRSDWEAMLSDVKANLPHEACGILAGMGNRVREVIPIRNILESSARYRMDPREQVEAMARIEELGLDLVGLYHSHIVGPRGLSHTDLEQLSHPDSAYLVWSKMHLNWECHAFVVTDDSVVEIPIQVQKSAT